MFGPGAGAEPVVLDVVEDIEEFGRVAAVAAAVEKYSDGSAVNASEFGHQGVVPDAVGDAPGDRSHVQVYPVDGAALFGAVAVVRYCGVFGAVEPQDGDRGGPEFCAWLRGVGGLSIGSGECGPDSRETGDDCGYCFGAAEGHHDVT